MARARLVAVGEPATSSSLLGRTLAGKYRIDQHVGSGAMGEVYRAKHIVLDTTIALKIMRADIAKDETFKERFYREAKAASRLDHPNSVRVLDFGVEEDGLVYLAMEFLHGRDLLAVLRQEWPISDQRIVELLQQTLSAVSTAHSLGIVHRDLKPENIMVSATTEDDGTVVERVKVCDFGIAKLSDSRGFQTEGGKALTSTGSLIGTPEYMSPEQARGDPLDPRSDLYSLGVVLYQLLTGKLPFTAENALGVVLKQVTDEAEAPSSIRPGVNPRLEAICKRAMQKPREARYQTAKEMRADLRNVFGYRQQSGGEESGPWIPFAVPHGGAPRSGPDLLSGPTLAGGAETLVAPVASSPKNDFSPKATSDGAALPIRASSSPPWVPMAIVAGVALLLGIVASVVVVVTTRKSAAISASSTSSASATSLAPSAPSTPDSITATNDAPPPVSPTAQATPTSTSVVTTRGTTGPNGKVTTTAATTKAGASAKGLASTPPPAPPGPSVAAIAATTPAAPTAPFNPASAHVVLGGLTATRVDAGVLRGKMSAVAPQLSECYRSALRMAGAPVPGSAEIQLSIDDRGRIMPVVMAAKHPEFARCAQGVLAGQSVPVSALEGGGSGATATQSLTLVP